VRPSRTWLRTTTVRSAFLFSLALLFGRLHLFSPPSLSSSSLLPDVTPHQSRLSSSPLPLLLADHPFPFFLPQRTMSSKPQGPVKPSAGIAAASAGEEDEDDVSALAMLLARLFLFLPAFLVLLSGLCVGISSCGTHAALWARSILIASLDRCSYGLECTRGRLPAEQIRLGLLSLDPWLSINSSTSCSKNHADDLPSPLLPPLHPKPMIIALCRAQSPLLPCWWSRPSSPSLRLFHPGLSFV
jgi:hypothetical protein